MVQHGSDLGDDTWATICSLTMKSVGRCRCAFVFFCVHEDMRGVVLHHLLLGCTMHARHRYRDFERTDITKKNETNRHITCDLHLPQVARRKTCVLVGMC